MTHYTLNTTYKNQLKAQVSNAKQHANFQLLILQTVYTLTLLLPTREFMNF